jgi:hypothetical protein
MEAIDYQLDKSKAKLNNSQKVRFYVTYKDMFGFHSFKPLFKEEITRMEYIFLLKRFIWSLFFVGQLPNYQDFYMKYKETVFSAYYVPHIPFEELKTFIQELIEYATNIIQNLQNVTGNKKELDKNTHFLLSVKKYKDMLYSKAQNFELIYDWFWFTTFKESEIEDFEIEKIAEKTIVLYETLRLKLMIFKELL